MHDAPPASAFAYIPDFIIAIFELCIIPILRIISIIDISHPRVPSPDKGSLPTFCTFPTYAAVSHDANHRCHYRHIDA